MTRHLPRPPPPSGKKYATLLRLSRAGDQMQAAAPQGKLHAGVVVNNQDCHITRGQTRAAFDLKSPSIKDIQCCVGLWLSMVAFVAISYSASPI